MKISILSLGVHGTNENYGAVLQILAFQEYLKQNFETDVEVINYYGLSTRYLLFLEDKPVIRFLKTITKEGKYIVKVLLKDKLTLRVNKHEKFISKYLNITKKYNYKNIKDAKFNSNVFIAESDVIWDPSFRKTGFDKPYFLNSKCFDNGKKIIYAASMGDIKYSNNDIKLFEALITNLDFISVREGYAKSYIEANFNKKVETLVDPTLLLDEKFYNEYIGSVKKTTSRLYVVVYFPAEVNCEVMKAAEEYSVSHNCDILYLCRTQIANKDVKIEFGIEEFLYYVKNSQAVFCDSFHGICFSVIYKKEFYAFVRDDGKKIIDICNRLNLEDHLVRNCKLPESLIDYDAVYKILDKERKQSYEWLSAAIGF